ncbi:hypothetical protein VTH06DRAFT_7603 [Thermothelomyces fergusii]
MHPNQSLLNRTLHLGIPAHPISFLSHHVQQNPISRPKHNCHRARAMKCQTHARENDAWKLDKRRGVVERRRVKTHSLMPTKKHSALFESPCPMPYVCQAERKRESETKKRKR